MALRNPVQHASLFVLVALLGAFGCSDGGGGSKRDDADAGSCKAGGVGCACIDGTRCDEGAVCSAGACAAATQQGWSVSDPSARACEARLTERTGSPVAEVAFASPARGTMVREAPLLGISFVAGKDNPLTSGVMTTSVTGKGEAPEVSSLRCFDANGALLANTTLTQD